MIIHTLNASPGSAAFRDCLRHVSADDALLLMGDAAYAAIEDTEACTTLRSCGAQIYLLQRDATAAGVTRAPEFVVAVDMDGFVELTERFERHMAWY